MKIFYSWQSDIKPVRNKLKTALVSAVDQIGKELSEADRPELDSDTQGTYGSEDIISTIFKKIDEAALFVADVTPIAATATKLIPNPNVMAELGYAMKVNNPNTRLFIYCTDKQVGAEKMPFDIRGKSLMGFSTSDSPSKIAKLLVPVLQGMFTNATSSKQTAEHPYVYVSGAAFQNWSDDQTATLDIKSTEPDEYFLELVEIEGKSSQPNRSLEANAITRGISITGVSQVFKSANPFVKMTLSRGDRKFYIKQEIAVMLGADGRYHFTQFVQRPSIVSSFDE